MSQKILILSALCAFLLSILDSTSVESAGVKGFIGCYKDTGKRDFANHFSYVYTTQQCIDKCRKFKMPYAGLQFYSECRCGYHYGRYGKGNAKCNTACKKGGGMCGGRWANSVYLTSPDLIQHEGFVGCFKDAATRDLPYHFSHVYTTQQCIDKCRKLKTPYAALQFYSECRCGYSYGRYAKGNAKCDTPCKKGGDMCGGRWANSVYLTSEELELQQPNDFLGCFKDTGHRDVSHHFTYVSSTQQCLDRCSHWKMPYAALQFYAECRCGYKYGSYGHGHAKCNTACKHGGGMCGGRWANSVYLTSVPLLKSNDLIGCFKDAGTRDLSYHFSYVSTTQQCIDKCRKYKMPYAGLQFYSECRCGYSYGRYAKGNAKCDTACKKGGGMCGGRWANSVYLTSAEYILPKGYIGCYKDTGARDLANHFSYVYTTQQCIDKCRKFKMPYAALQFYSECRCGYKYGSYGQAHAKCDTPCKKGGGMCGGRWANSIYKV